MTGPEPDAVAAPPTSDEPELARIDLALSELAGPPALADLPLADAATVLENLHQELQAALSSLDRTS